MTGIGNTRFAMDLLLLDAVIIALAIVLALLAQGVRKYRFEYEERAPDYLKSRRDRLLRSSVSRRLLDPYVVAFSALVPKLGLESHRARVRRLLVQAGDPWGYSPEDFIGWGMVLAALVYFGIVMILFLFEGSVRWLFPVAPALVTYLLTYQGLKSRALERRMKIDMQLPFFLDLLAMSLEAGALFTTACRRLVEHGTGGPMEEEVDHMLRELDAGVTLPDALANLERRTGSEEVAVMVQAARQGQVLGTPLARIFRDQSSLSRYRRSQRAEQLAAKLPNRLAVPTVFLMLACLLLLFGPIIVKATRGGFTE